MIIAAVSEADTTKRGTAEIHVRAPAVRQVMLTLEPTVVAGATRQAVVQVDADPGADDRVTFLSSHPQIASVDDNGLVVGVSPGATQITARSVAFPAIQDVKPITVTAPATTSSWMRTSVGAGGAVSNWSIVDAIFDTNGNGMVAIDASVGNLVAASGAMQRTGDVWSIRTTAGFTGKRFTSAAGSSVTDWYVSLLGNNINGNIPEGPPAVLRWNGNAFSDTQWPTPQGNNTDAPRLVSTGIGQLLGYTTTGEVWRYANGAWTLAFGGENNITATSIDAWASDSAVLGRCRVNGLGERLALLRGSIVEPLPTNTIPAAGNDDCARSVLALAGGDILAAINTFVARYDNGEWTTLTTTMESNEVFTKVERCGNNNYAGTNNGRVFRVDAAALVNLGGDISAVGGVGAINCGPGNVVRVGSRSGLLTRLISPTWVDEHFAPELNGVHLATATQGAMVGENGVVFRWNGTGFTRVRRTRSTQVLNAVWVSGAGDVFAVGNSYSLNGMTSGAHLLRSNGDNWVSDHVPEHLFGTSIWGSAANNVFAVVRSHPWLESAGRILRWDGASWVVTYNENASPFAVHGVSGTDILATGVDGRVWRWNGTTWNDAASISNAQGRVVNRLFMLSSTLAYAGNNCVAGVMVQPKSHF